MGGFIKDWSLRLPPKEERVFRKLKYGDPELHLWKIENGGVNLEEPYFALFKDLEEELLRMARAGISGSVVAQSEDGAPFKYVLDPRRERVLVFWGRISFPKKPKEMLR